MLQVYNVIFFHGHHLRGRMGGGEGKEEGDEKTEGVGENKVMGEEKRERKTMSHLEPSPLEGDPKVLGATISMGSSG